MLQKHQTVGRLLHRLVNRSVLGVILGTASVAGAAEPAPLVPAAGCSPANSCVPNFELPESPANLLPSPSPAAPSSAPAAMNDYDFGGGLQGNTLLASNFVPNMIGDMLGSGSQTAGSVSIANLQATATNYNLLVFLQDPQFLADYQPNPASPNPWFAANNISTTAVTVNQLGTANSFTDSNVANLSFTTVQSQAYLFNPPTGIDLNYLQSIIGDPLAVAAYIQANPQLFQMAVQDSPEVRSVVENAVGGFGLQDGEVVFQDGEVGIDPSDPQVGTGVWNYTYDLPIYIPGGSIAAAPSMAMGRQKLAENASPIPRDRVFINYSYFDNTPLYRGGVNVNRVTPGFEKTFFNGNMSFELRTPFATTLDSTVDQDGITNTSNTEFGNMTMYLKALLWNDERWAFSTGLGVAVPTADDFLLRSGGTDMVFVDNQSVHLLPFFAATYTPNNRFFAQAMMQFDIDVNGNPVSVSQFDDSTFSFTGVMTRIDRPYDYTYMYLDFNTGYWVYLNPDSDRLVTGLAPIAELHINQTVGNSSRTRGTVTGVNWDFGPYDSLTTVNGTVGLTAILRDRSTLTAAYCTPLGTDQQFDGEFRLSFNWFFGNSRPTNRLYRTSTF